MNPQKQRIAIAEACGWKVINDALCHITPDKDGLPQIAWIARLPDYLTDLNAMAEAIATLGYDKQQDWLNKLSYVLGFKSRNNWVLSDLVNATAAQRAEAFLKTIGKWEEER
jgi:hypothetical protein